MNSTDNEYVIGFEPNASAKKVHHIIIYGCSTPGKFLKDTPSYVWECGEMNSGDFKKVDGAPELETGSACGSGEKNTIIFAWALDAPAIDMPPKVGFKIGGNSGINYLVLNVHYGNTEVFRADPEATDNSGIKLHTISGTDHGVSRQAGILLMWSNGYVPQGKSKHTIECQMTEDKIIHPIRFRTHTHKLGTWVGGYVKPTDREIMQMVLIGEHNPQQPQMFYPVADPNMIIKKGDRVYAYCDYNNTRDHTVYIGATGNDEMCNFYLMYWTEGELLTKQDCSDMNPH